MAAGRDVAMIHNFAIYFIFLLYLAAATFVLVRRRSLPFHPFLVYCGLLLPAFLLVPLGFALGLRHMPQYQVVIHGYRLALREKTRRFFIGSDIGKDDVRFHYRFRGQETISPGILSVAFATDAGGGKYRLTQTDPFSANTISIDGRPLRSLRLEPGVEHRITFARFRHDESEDHVLGVTIRGNKPLFRYKDLYFSDGFSHELLWGWFSIPYKVGKVRHLAFANRIRMPGLPVSVRDLLQQAAIVRLEDGYYLAANDARIRLDGRELPNAVTLSGGSVISLATREIGEGRALVSFKIVPPDERRGLVSIELLDEYKRKRPLPLDLAEDRICFTANESYYSDTLDIVDPQFPTAGTVINKEGNGFVFRGQILQKNEIYSCGKAVFSIDQVNAAHIYKVALFGLMFLLSFLFLPPHSLKKEPLIGVVVSAAALLLALRQVLAFRAWQGPPFKFSILMDSMIAPYLFMLVVLVLVGRYRAVRLLHYLWVRVRNFFRTGFRLSPPPLDAGAGGPSFLSLVLFGLLIFLGFRQQVGGMFLVLILLFLSASLVVNALEGFENRLAFYSSSAGGSVRWKPAMLLVSLVVGLILLGPLLGGKEVIAILPGRPRPDIFIQLALLFVIAYFSGVWEREAGRYVPNPFFILLTLAVAVAFPFIQGVASDDMGFFAMVSLPLLLVLIAATWKLDNRVRFFLIAGLLFVLACPLLLRFHLVSLDQISMRRVAFFADKARIKAEYFFDYLAHLPILWSSNQGLLGGGFFRGDWYPALAETSVNDNVASVFIQGELGGAGTVLTITIFAIISLCGILFVAENRSTAGGFRAWFLFGISLMMIWTAATMFLANLGYFPLTGKNLPLLGIDSLNDVIRYGLLIGFSVRYMDLLKEE